MRESVVVEGSGNVFADIGIPNPEEHLLKADLAIKIASVIRERGLTQAQAAEIADIPQPKISNLVNGQLRDISSDRLMRILNRLGVSISIVLVDEPGWECGQIGLYDETPDHCHELEVEVEAQVEPSAVRAYG